MCAKWLLDAPAFSSNFAVHGWLSINSVPKFQNSNGVDGKSHAKEGVALTSPDAKQGGPKPASSQPATEFTFQPSRTVLEFWNFGTRLILLLLLLYLYIDIVFNSPSPSFPL